MIIDLGTSEDGWTYTFDTATERLHVVLLGLVDLKFVQASASAPLRVIMAGPANKIAQAHYGSRLIDALDRLIMSGRCPIEPAYL